MKTSAPIKRKLYQTSICKLVHTSKLQNYKTIKTPYQRIKSSVVIKIYIIERKLTTISQDLRGRKEGRKGGEAKINWSYARRQSFNTKKKNVATDL